MKKRSAFTKTQLMVALLAVVFVATLIVWLTKRNTHQMRPQLATQPAASPASPPGIPPAPRSSKSASSNSSPTPSAERAKTFETFRTHPFAVAKASGANEWTAEDGRDPDVIMELAHNEIEVQRLMEENKRIERRQLVYRKETVPMLLQKVQGTGRSLQRFTLPGVDGREFDVEVTQTNLAAGLQGGSVNGRLKGRANSMVSVGFSNGNESFNIISPDDGVYITADAREPGEVMVKEIDPDKYSPPAGNTPDFILTNEPLPGQKPRPAFSP